jgi:hypothetical protein
MKKIANNEESVYLVGHSGPEHNFVLSVHKSHNGAFRTWNKLRLDLLEEAKRGLKYSKEDAKRNLKKGKWNDEDKPFSKETIDYFKKVADKGEEMYLEMIEKLSCEDPKKIDNYPQDTPYIKEREVED